MVAPPDVDLAVPEGVRLVHDEAPFEGPLAGCMTGLIAAREPLVVVAGGDMPSLEPAVLALLIRALVASSADAALLEHRGRRQQLPFAVRTGAGTDAARRLLAQGERRLGALTDRLPVRVLAEEEWRPLDPDARTLRDVDEPGGPAGRLANRARTHEDLRRRRSGGLRVWERGAELEGISSGMGSRGGRAERAARRRRAWLGSAGCGEPRLPSRRYPASRRWPRSGRAGR